MRIDFSEPECSTCFHYRTSAILNTQESEPSNAIGHDSADVVPHDSADVVPTTTSSPLHRSSPIRFGTVTSLAPPVSSEPAQSFGSTILTDGGLVGAFESMQAPLEVSFGSVASTTRTSLNSSPFKFTSPTTFGFSPVVTSVSSGPAQDGAPRSFTFGSVQASMSGSAASATSTSSTPSPFRYGSIHAPVQASTSSSTSFSSCPGQDFDKTASSSDSLFGNGGNFARPDVDFLPATNTSTTTVVFGTTPVSVSSLSGPTSSTTPKNPFSSSFPGFGVSSNHFGTMPPFGSVSAGLKTSSTTVCGDGSVSAGFKASSPSNPFGPNPLTKTPLFGDSSVSAGINTSSLQPPFSTNPCIGHPLFASHQWSRLTENGSRYPPYAPTPSLGENGNMKLVSISASESYQFKNHDELRWEDYKKGDKGVLFPAACSSPIGSSPNAVFPTSLFGYRSIPYDPQSRFGQTDGTFTSFATMFPSSSSTSCTTSFAAPTCPNFQRPHETAAFSSPASGCTACGAMASSSAPRYFNFNGAPTPPPAATPLPGFCFSTSGSLPSMFGTTPAAQATTIPAVQATTTPTLQAYPMLFGTNLVVVQATIPALQAYPAHGYILLPFAAMTRQ